jgi:hypothetical protein
MGPWPSVSLYHRQCQASRASDEKGLGSLRRGWEATDKSAPSSWMPVGAGLAIKINPQTALK